MAQNPCYMLADASVAALWNSHCEAGSAVQGFPNCKHRLAFPILVPAWIELISTNGEWSNVKVMRHSPTDAHEDENTWVPTWLIESAFGPYYLPQVLPEQASLQVQRCGSSTPIMVFDDMPMFFNKGGLHDIALTMMELSVKHMKEYGINIEESPLVPLPFPTIGAGVVHNNLAKQYAGAHWFRTEEWFRFPVDMSSRWDPQACKDYVTNEDENHTDMGFKGKLFHGCPFGAFLGMLGKGGFVAGEGACKKNTRSVSGAFCTTDFFDAFCKGQGHMFDFAKFDPQTQQPLLNLMCMPVVVEVVPMHVITHVHGRKYCMEGIPGELVPGCLVRAVHMNKFIFKNYLALQKCGPIPLDCTETRLCGQTYKRHVGLVKPKQASCGAVVTKKQDGMHKSNGGYWYCNSCGKFWTNRTRVLAFGPLQRD